MTTASKRPRGWHLEYYAIDGGRKTQNNPARHGGALMWFLLGTNGIQVGHVPLAEHLDRLWHGYSVREVLKTATPTDFRVK